MTSPVSSPVFHLFPTPTDLLLTFLLSLPLLYVLRHRLRNGAAPINWPFVGMLPSILSNFHRLHDFTVDLLRLFGGTAISTDPGFLTCNILLTAEPANIHHIFTSNFHNYPKGPDFAQIFDVLGAGIFNSDFDSWKLQRKLAHEFMSQPRFRSFVVETSKLKVEHGIMTLLSKASDAGTVIDLQDVFLRFTFDTTCILVMGVDPGCLSLDPKPVPFAKAMDDAEEVILFRHVIPMICWKLLRWLRIGEERRLHAAWETIDSFVKGEILKKKGELCKSRDDLLSSYLNSDSDFDRTTEFLRDTVINLLLAGRDTTAAGLSWFLYLVSTCPRVQDRILDELRGTCRIAACPAGIDLEVFDAESLSRLVYLHAALLETLRLYPPVPYEHKRAVGEDVLPSGHRVGKGTKVLVSLYSMARMEGVWGEDCGEFKPERWINEKGRLRYEPSYKFMAFNSGPRTCLGKDVALTQMKAAAAAVLWNFEVEVVEAEEVRPKVSIILHMEKGLTVRVRRRMQEEMKDLDR